VTSPPAVIVPQRFPQQQAEMGEALGKLEGYAQSS
jgi:hypothetical protein